jgi:ketosteroid isomerase-like protein
VNTTFKVAIIAFTLAGLWAKRVESLEPQKEAAIRSRSDAARDAPVVDQVREATLAFYRALNNADAAAADRFLLPGGDSFPRSGAKLLPEAPTAEQSLQDLQKLFSAGLKFDVKVNDLQVKAYGACAVATLYLDGTTLPGTNRPPIRGSFRASYVWIRQGGEWRIAHFHISPLNEKQ